MTRPKAAREIRRRFSAGAGRLESGFSPREQRLLDAFLDAVDDQMLTRIINGFTMSRQPLLVAKRRDLWVAASVVQWLATNVGHSVLRQAGWEYTKWDEDRAQVDALHRLGSGGQ